MSCASGNPGEGGLKTARGLPDYLLALFHQSKRFYAENVKAKAMRNEIR